MDYLGFATLQDFAEAAAGGVVGNLAWLILLGIAFVFRAPIAAFSRNVLGGLSRYRGTYFAYRWSSSVHPDNEGELVLVEPKVEIRRAKLFNRWEIPFGPLHLIWIPPNGEARGYLLLPQKGREIYAYGKGETEGSYASFVLQRTGGLKPTVLSGISTFVDQADRLVTGEFLLSTQEISRQAVETLMRPNAVYSTKAIAVGRQRKFKDLVEGKAMPNLIETESNL